MSKLAIELVAEAFKDKLVNENDELAFSVDSFYRKVGGKWDKIPENHALMIIEVNFRRWELDGLFKDLDIEAGTCPHCKKPGILDALSRDNSTDICSDCGTREAFAGLTW